VACAGVLCPSITSLLGCQQNCQIAARLVHCLLGYLGAYVSSCDALHEQLVNAAAAATAASLLPGCMSVVLFCDCRTSPFVSQFKQQHCNACICSCCSLGAMVAAAVLPPLPSIHWPLHDFLTVKTWVVVQYAWA
jgi:hypothetical protein